MYLQNAGLPGPEGRGGHLQLTVGDDQGSAGLIMS